MVTATKPATNHMPKETTAKGKKQKEAPKTGADANQPDLKNTLAQIEKQFGEGAIMPLGSDAAVQIEGIPTGSLSLDIALGGQGIPKGRIIEIFGPESSGKTTLALHVVARPKRPAASPPSSTPSTPWTQVGPRSWASSSKRCWSASRAAAKKPCTSPKC